MSNTYTFSGKAKKLTIALMAIGVLALVYGIMSIFSAEGEEAHHHAVQHFWSNVLINGFFFFGISLAATFFLALQYAAEAGWSVVLKRVIEAVSMYLPIGAAVMLVVFLAGTLHWHHLYHWMAEGVMTPGHEHYDEIIAGKKPYLNQPFFWFRALLFMGGYILYQRKFRQWSLQEDIEGGLSIHKKVFTWSAAFMVFFGYTSMVGSWDWIMSIDTHWFSTLFGWYIFSGMWATAMIATVILILFLKSKGLLPEVNDSHIHDLGKWTFAVSFLWSYLWFAQFMLIWYSNIPEEVTYYIARIEDYKVLFFGMFFINFVFPMILLMDKDAKKSPFMLSFVGVIIFIGHWLDVYLAITPGTMKDHGHIGLLEIGMFLGFLGLFIFTALSAVAKAPLVVKNNPYLEESLHLHH